MTALEVIRKVEALGGQLIVDGEDLRVGAATPLPDGILDSIRAEKPAIMIALGAPSTRPSRASWQTSDRT